MSEPFKVPEPSEGAVKAYAAYWEIPPAEGHSASLRAAYAVDVPRIVRAEVERALVEANLAFGVHSSNIEWRDRYLAARFPEAAPESAEERVLASLAKAYPYLVKHADHIDGEFSNALAELRRMLAGKKPEAAKTVAAVLNERLEPRDSLDERRAATAAYLRDIENREENGVKMLPAERDFLRALAAERAALDDVMPARLSGIQFCGHITEERREGAAREYKARQETVAAARRVVEEARNG